MTKNEWIEIGMEKGIIDEVFFEPIPFSVVFRKWFLMKMNVVKPQSLDRIECTYNMYYHNSVFESFPVHEITENTVIQFLNDVITTMGAITEKEFGRLFQIVNNVRVFALDLKIGGAKLLNWSLIKRYIDTGKIHTDKIKEYAISEADKTKLFKAVLQDDIYPDKRSACLCLVLNFFLGLRVGELAGLTFSDFDLDKRVVRIHKTESKYYERDAEGNRCGSLVYRVQEDVKTIYSVREIPLTVAAIYIYSRIVAHHNRMNYDSCYLAYDGSDTILSRSLDRTLHRLCSLTGIKKFNTHRIRKTFASDLHKGGVPTRTITDLLGHSEMSTTEHCYILGYDNMDSLRNDLESVLKVVY